MKRPYLAFALSLVLPGAGLCYVGRHGWAVANLLAVVAVWVTAALALPGDVFDRGAAHLGVLFPVSGALAWYAADGHNRRREAEGRAAWHRDRAAAHERLAGPGAALGGRGRRASPDHRAPAPPPQGGGAVPGSADEMRPCSPAELARRRPGSLRPVVFSGPRPALPEDCRRLLAEHGLPRELTIACYNDVTLRFSGTATPLAAIWDRDRQRGHMLGELPSGWARFWHLADQTYLQGGGWVCVEEDTGRLVVIDMDLADPIYLLSSSVQDFYTTLAYFLEWSEQTGGSPTETIRLRDALRRQDGIPPEELEPFWLNIIDATLEGDPINLVVSLGPMGADPGAATDGGA